MPRDFAPLFKNRQFIYLWLNQALSQISYNLLNFTLIVLIYKLTNSTFAVSIMIIFFYLPSLVFSLPAGVASDLLDKRKVMILADLLWAAAVLGIFFAKGHFWSILILTFLAKFFDSFFFPAEAASLPIVVNKDKLTEANSLFSINTYLGMLMGFLAAGPLMRFVSDGAPLIAASILTLTGAFFVYQMKPMNGESSLKKLMPMNFFHIITQKVVEGLEFIKTQLVVLLSLVVAVTGQVLAVLIANLLPEYAEKYLKISAEDSSFILVAPLALGVITGLILLNKWLKKSLKRNSLRTGLFLATVAFFGLSVTPLLKNALLPQHFMFKELWQFEELLPLSAVAALFSYCLGTAGSLVLIPALTFSQENTPVNLRGRAFGLYGAITAFLVIGLVVPLGGFVEFFGVPVILGFLAMVCLLLLIISFTLLSYIDKVFYFVNTLRKS